MLAALGRDDPYRAAMISIPTPMDGIVVEELGAELCVMRLDTGDVLVLNQTASDIWLLADGLTTTEQLITSLASAYGSDPETITPQVVGVLLDLEKRGFLVERGANT